MKFAGALREPFSAASHLSGALAGMFGAAYLLGNSDGSFISLSAILIYSLALVALFLVSGLFHGLHCSAAAMARLERLDYAAIYLFIAGTYTPICLFVIKGSFGIWLLSSVWWLAVVGAWLAITRGPSARNLQVAIYLAMGWAFLFALPSLSSSLSSLAFNLLITGGVIYSVGAVIFALNWPTFFQHRYTAHDFWHCLVLLGSAAHFLVVAQIVV